MIEQCRWIRRIRLEKDKDSSFFLIVMLSAKDNIVDSDNKRNIIIDNSRF